MVSPSISSELLLLAATLILAWGFRRGPGPHLAGGFFLLLGALVVALPAERILSSVRSSASAAALLALLAYFYLRERKDVPSASAVAVQAAAIRRSNAVVRLYLAAAIVVAGLLLLWRLGTYSPELLTWEATVVGGFPGIGGFAQIVDEGVPPLRYMIRCLRWDAGTLAAGQTSLFYGAPTYALFQLVGFSTWTLRLMPAVATLLSILVIYALARRSFGFVVGGAAAALWATSTCVSFYGRYGTSPAGMLLAVLLATDATWRLLEPGARWWRGMIAAAALYAATVQYAPGRIIACYLLGFLVLVLLLRSPRLGRQQWAAGAMVVVGALLVWHVEARARATEGFLNASGEQFFFVAEHPQSIEGLFGKQLLDSPASGPLDLKQRWTLLQRFIAHNLPSYAQLLMPTPTSEPLGEGSAGVLPRLYDPILAPFIVWGLLLSLRNARDWRHACLLLWMIAGSVPLLLTNRVDSHRALILLPPLVLWGSLGVGQAARCSRTAGVPAALNHTLAFALLLAVAAEAWVRLHPKIDRRPGLAETLLEETRRLPGPVTVGALINDRELGLAALEWMERSRRLPATPVRLLVKQPLLPLRDEGGGPPPSEVRRLRDVAAQSTVLLAPAENFGRLAEALRETGGTSVSIVGGPALRILRFSAP